jgi:hypothetical protein
VINNYICADCNKREVCKIKDILAKFSDDAKNDLGVTLTICECLNYLDINAGRLANKTE